MKESLLFGGSRARVPFFFCKPPYHVLGVFGQGLERH